VSNTDFDPRPPIGYPRVDLSVRHRPERWKRDYLAGLGGRSYQQNLLARDQDAGLGFELDRYTGWTLEAMRTWRLRGPHLLEVKLETISQSFDATMLATFRHLGFNDRECTAAMQIAATEDLTRMSDVRIADDDHIYSRTVSKWRAMLSAEQVALFERRYGDLIANLGYAPSSDGGRAD
jgi:hypothetical protein